MNKFNIGDKVSSKEYSFTNAIVVGIEKVKYNPRYNDSYSTPEEHYADQDTWQYTVVFMDSGMVYKETYYEQYLD